MSTSSPFKAEIIASITLPPTELQNLAESLAAQLRADESIYNEGGSPSPLAVDMPRAGAGIDKKNRLAHLVAQILYPPQNEAEAIWSTIRYGQLVSKLSKVVRGGWKRAEAERLALKQAPRIHMDRGAFCAQKTRGVSRQVHEPRAMPVALTDAAEFGPFFEFLRQNKVSAFVCFVFHGVLTD